MKKQDKKIIDDVDFLSKLMEKNNLKELEISDGKVSYKLKKNQSEIKKNTNFKKVVDASNIAARALEKCQSNTVIITKNLRDLLGRTKFSVSSMGNYSLKGLEGDWELFEVENHQ